MKKKIALSNLSLDIPKISLDDQRNLKGSGFWYNGQYMDSWSDYINYLSDLYACTAEGTGSGYYSDGGGDSSDYGGGTGGTSDTWEEWDPRIIETIQLGLSGAAGVTGMAIDATLIAESLSFTQYGTIALAGELIGLGGAGWNAASLVMHVSEGGEWNGTAAAYMAGTVLGVTAVMVGSAPLSIVLGGVSLAVGIYADAGSFDHITFDWWEDYSTGY